jgi:hypothetical protein
MTLTPAQAAEEPLLTEADMKRRIEELIAPAIHNGQLWILFLDARRRQLPLMVPIEDMPATPDASQVSSLIAVLRELRPEYDSVILVMERLGTDAVAAVDRRWAAALRDEAAKQGVTIAAIFALTPDRVSPVRPQPSGDTQEHGGRATGFSQGDRRDRDRTQLD